MTVISLKNWFILKVKYNYFFQSCSSVSRQYAAYSSESIVMEIHFRIIFLIETTSISPVLSTNTKKRLIWFIKLSKSLNLMFFLNTSRWHKTVNFEWRKFFLFFQWFFQTHSNIQQNDCSFSYLHRNLVYDKLLK